MRSTVQMDRSSSIPTGGTFWSVGFSRRQSVIVFYPAGNWTSWRTLRRYKQTHIHADLLIFALGVRIKTLHSRYFAVASSNWIYWHYIFLLPGIMQNYYDHNVFHGTVDATKLNFVATIALTFCGLLGPVNQILTDLFRGPRTIMGVSTVLMSLGLFSASYSTEIWHLYLTQSILYGIGSALFFIVSMAICPMWFPRNRGLAMGVIVSGSGVGGLVTPFIMHALNESLGGAW